MNLRHAAALASIGWYLLMPPLSSPHTQDTSAPLSEWKFLGSYDSALDCQSSQYSLMKSWMKHPPKSMSSEDAKIAMLAAEYIATDDPRLKGD
jgi:hypothetical protein